MVGLSLQIVLDLANEMFFKSNILLKVLKSVKVPPYHYPSQQTKTSSHPQPCVGLPGCFIRPGANTERGKRCTPLYYLFSPCFFLGSLAILTLSSFDSKHSSRTSPLLVFGFCCVCGFAVWIFFFLFLYHLSQRTYMENTLTVHP